ncbi:MAG: hypothetical protein Q7S09_02920 [bacterium]|nr:hypothetical protein [bacterium]
MDAVNGKPQEQQPFADEEEIKILEKRLQLLREGLRPPGSAESVKEAKEAGEILEGSSQGKGPGGVPPPPTAIPAPSSMDVHFHDVKAEELKGYETDRQLKALVEVALERSLGDAVDIARRLDDAYLLDAFHDVLCDDTELNRQLVERGKLKEL